MASIVSRNTTIGPVQKPADGGYRCIADVPRETLSDGSGPNPVVPSQQDLSGQRSHHDRHWTPRPISSKGYASIGQSTPFRPMGGCSPPKVVTLGVERPPKLLTNPHFSPGVLRMFKASQISCHAAGTRSSAGFLASREPLRGRTFSSSPSTHLKLPQKLSPFR